MLNTELSFHEFCFFLVKKFHEKLKFHGRGKFLIRKFRENSLFTEKVLSN